ncbi:MAG TPA: GNAT family N-acetyltransferase [candidate division Zixibacteria bacterium]|nr:GNAT family N-acetyltransferase [candidate division Zixibacteria bacterium]
MTPEDFDFAVQITDKMNWNLTTADFEFMIELEPDGCFILLENSKKIGLATTVSFGPIAWFGNLIVNESHRKRGAGSQLVRHSIEYLKRKQVKTIGLYAYTERIPFYERLGFKYDTEFTVLNGRGSSLPVKPAAELAKKQDLQKIIEFDQSCFGASRRKLLEPIILDPDNLCCLSAQGKRMVGYAVAKVYRKMGEIGPLVCQKGREDVAVTLLRSLLSRLEGYEVSMCVPSKESTILDSVKTLRFAEIFRVARMFHGSPIAEDCICMAESLERG